MDELRIGEVADRTGLATSAIRYYEDCKLIAPSRRVGGQRRYESSAVERLALIAFAKDAGFTLAEIRRLIGGTREATTASERWRVLVGEKLAALDEAAQRIETMRGILRRALRCGCIEIDECARRIATAAERR